MYFYVLFAERCPVPVDLSPLPRESQTRGLALFLNSEVGIQRVTCLSVIIPTNDRGNISIIGHENGKNTQTNTTQLRVVGKWRKDVMCMQCSCITCYGLSS